MKRLLQLHVSGRVHLEFLVNQSERVFFYIMLVPLAAEVPSRVRSRPPPRCDALGARALIEGHVVRGGSGFRGMASEHGDADGPAPAHQKHVRADGAG